MSSMSIDKGVFGACVAKCLKNTITVPLDPAVRDVEGSGKSWPPGRSPFWITLCTLHPMFQVSGGSKDAGDQRMGVSH